MWSILTRRSSISGSLGKTSRPAEKSYKWRVLRGSVRAPLPERRKARVVFPFTHLAIRQRLDQSFLIDHPTSSSIDQNTPLLHLFKLGFPETLLGLVIQGQVQTDQIAPRQQLVPRFHILAFKRWGRGDGVPVMINDLHAKGQTPLSDDAPDPSHPDDPDGLAFGIMSRAQSSLPFPRSSVHLGLVVLSEGREDEEHGRRRCRIVHSARGVRDLDPPSGGGGDVDLVVPCSVVTDVFDRRGESVDDLCVEDSDRVGRVVVSTEGGRRPTTRQARKSNLNVDEGIVLGLTGK
jgi:hypothetical protein